ncbi:PREDICTED: putative helicase mov-10-B.1 [Cyprinodon variegatus]|uniref:putative helicase mov-10-B.1 n=1 Tax=Cyprinodon variegatus TaxID=28743 RepID=UPI0007429683|nr:PREDICTED: putative helicase mov-10-B.1 [Cyprinodon variegatus]
MDEAWDQQMIYAAQTGEGASGGQNLEISFTKGQMAMQPQGNIGLHKKMAKLFHQYKKKGDETIFKKYAVRVTSDHSPNDAKISLTVAEKESSVLFSVENSGLQQVYFTLQNFDFVENIFTIRDCDGNLIRTITDHLLLPGDSYDIKINFTSDHPGFYEQILVFKFKRGYDHPEFFEIMRLLEVEFQIAQSEKDCLHGSEVRKRFQTANRRPFTRGENLATPVVHLKKYPITKNFRENKEIQEILRSNPLNWGNYSRRFHLLLHLEEYKIRKDIHQCSLNKVPLTFYEMDKNMLVVKAEHFLNKSLTVLTGCIVEVTPLKQKMDKVFYKGWVDDVDEEQIYLRIYEDLPEDFQNEVACSLVFLLHRMPLRIQHRAADLVRKHQLRDLVFPTQHSCLAPPIPKLIRTPVLESNPEQCRAVEHILARSAKPAPYLIFGPPGTGKSVTLVEVIKQIVKTQDCNILVCAPSNSVTDHLCKKILEENIVPRQVFRLYSLSYNANKIPESVKEHCSFDGTENYFEIPTKEELMSYKIMVTTLQSAGRLVTAGVPPGYYSYIIVDEAGQAKELECLIPIAGLLKPKTGQVVLAGDPKQLGPVIISTIAERFGLALLCKF